MNDFNDNDMVIVYRNTEIVYEGMWSKRPSTISNDCMADWYLLSDDEEYDKLVIIYE